VRWTKEQLAAHPNRDKLLGKIPSVPPLPAATAPPDLLPKIAPNEGAYSFTVPGLPVGKPRMTQQDKWQKRPRVLRYREYCDRIRAASKLDSKWDCYAIEIIAYFPPTKSWSKKKQQSLIGKMMRAKPDWDNISKSVCDALFKEDSCLAGGTTWKFYCAPGKERTEITVLYFNESV